MRTSRNLLEFGLAIGVALLSGSPPALAEPEKTWSPEVRVGIAIISPSGKEFPWSTHYHPDGAHIVAHVETTVLCWAIVAGFDRKTGDLPPGWLPEFRPVVPRYEALMPKPPATWNWETKAGPVDIHVLVLPEKSQDKAEAEKLVTAMRNAKSPAVRHLQTAKLRELMGRIDSKSAVDAAREARQSALPDLVSGVFRFIDPPYDWRDDARRVEFRSSNPRHIVFRDAD